jgi:hypothetical protein
MWSSGKLKRYFAGKNITFWFVDSCFAILYRFLLHDRNSRKTQQNAGKVEARLANGGVFT